MATSVSVAVSCAALMWRRRGSPPIGGGDSDAISISSSNPSEIIEFETSEDDGPPPPQPPQPPAPVPQAPLIDPVQPQTDSDDDGSPSPENVPAEAAAYAPPDLPSDDDGPPPPLAQQRAVANGRAPSASTRRKAKRKRAIPSDTDSDDRAESASDKAGYDSDFVDEDERYECAGMTHRAAASSSDEDEQQFRSVRRELDAERRARRNAATERDGSTEGHVEGQGQGQGQGPETEEAGQDEAAPGPSNATGGWTFPQNFVT